MKITLTFFYSIDILILKGREKVEENIENKNEVISSTDQNTKKDKTSLVLFIIATVLFTIAVVFTILFAIFTLLLLTFIYHIKHKSKNNCLK